MVSFDLDGHGTNSNTIFNPSQVTQNIAENLDFLDKGNHLPNLILGQSLGGALAIQYLAENNAIDCRASIFASVPIHIDLKKVEVFKEIAGFMRSSFISQWKHYGIYGSLPAAGNFRRDDYPIRLPPNNQQLDYKKIIPDFINMMDINKQCSKIPIPALLLYGTYDTLSTIQHGKQLQNNLPNATLHIEKKESHFTTLLCKNVKEQITNWIHYILIESIS